MLPFLTMFHYTIAVGNTEKKDYFVEGDVVIITPEKREAERAVRNYGDTTKPWTLERQSSEAQCLHYCVCIELNLNLS